MEWVMRSWPERKERHARIEIIPMIDVMMFLLVFFVLISTNVLPALGLKISPPTTSTPDKIVERTKYTVGIDKDGKTYLDGEAMALADISDRLKAANTEGKPIAVVIAGDQGAALQSVVDVLDTLKSAGIGSAKIVTRAR
jgi:biopolymer transport protein ExbD